MTRAARSADELDEAPPSRGGEPEGHAALAETCRRFRGWRAGFLVGNPLLEQAFLRVVGQPRIKKPLANANLRAYFYLYEL